MAQFDAMDMDFDEVTLLGKPALFTNLRIDRATIPQGYYAYDIRHDDIGWSDPIEVANYVLVNHMGTVITRDKLRMPAERGLDVDAEALNFAAGDCRAMGEFMQRYPPKTKQTKEHER